jgi:acetyl esterase/lipase
MTRIQTRLLVGATALIVLIGCATALSRHEAAGVSMETVTYTPDAWPEALTADVYRPTHAGPHPGLLVVHGGGWERRSRSDMDRIALRYARRGFVVMNISYRFAPEAQYPAQVHDLQQAMRWLHREAESLELDPELIAAMGYSAGAHLVSLMALAAGTQADLDQPHGGPETRPVAVVAGGAPMDLRKYPGGRLVPQFLGGRIDEIPETFAAASPVTRVHGEAPPFFLFHGGSDRLVTIDHAEDFERALARQGVPVSLYRLPWRGHILAFLTAGSALDEADDFLDRYLTPDADEADGGAIAGY